MQKNLKPTEKTELNFVRCFIPDVQVYLQAEPKVLNPYQDTQYFRGEESFNGSLTGWKRWQKPSPELLMSPELTRMVLAEIQMHQDEIGHLHDLLLQQIALRIPLDQPIVLVSILRAGVYVALGLAQSLVAQGFPQPGIVALGLFHEAGFDDQALQQITQDYAHHYPIFVDGWTGRGVVARELRTAYALWKNQNHLPHLPQQPILATLVDPGHYGDCWGTDQDTLVPCAYFTAPQTLGFSRAFIRDPQEMWCTYPYPDTYEEPELMAQWLASFQKVRPLPPKAKTSKNQKPQNLRQLLTYLAHLCAENAVEHPEKSTWKVNINEIIRTFINRNPRCLFIGLTAEEAQNQLPTLHYLAQKKKVPVYYHPELRTTYNCLAAVKLS